MNKLARQGPESLALAGAAALVGLFLSTAHACPPWWQTKHGCATNKNVGEVNDCLPYPLAGPGLALKVAPHCDSGKFYWTQDDTHAHNWHKHCVGPKGKP